jgi:hypothetical protein
LPCFGSALPSATWPTSRSRPCHRAHPASASERRRWFVAGKPGSEYRVEVRNRGATDILAVISVDGVNVVTGETASPSQSGYVLDRSHPLSVAGWRKSLDHVAAFYFTDLGDSYASRTGRPENVGVIGVAVFRRKPEPLAEAEAPSLARESDSAAAAAAPRANAAEQARKSIGTGHGRTESSHARYVEFERETDSPAEVIAIHYDTHANLVAGHHPRAEGWPALFPAASFPIRLRRAEAAAASRLRCEWLDLSP